MVGPFGRRGICPWTKGLGSVCMSKASVIKPGRHVFLLSRLFLGGVFVWASFDKILHPMSFAVVIKDYQLLPESLINLFAVTLPWIEIFLGVLLISGAWLQGAVLLVNFLLVVFTGALAFNMARGLDVHCGCFTSAKTGTPMMTWYLIRDVIFISIGVYMFCYIFKEGK